MNKKVIAVVSGGDSSESIVSMRSSVEVLNSLDRELFEPYMVIIKGVDWQTDHGHQVDKNYFGFMSADGNRVKFDYALIMVHGTPGENGILQGYFDLLKIPYSSCDTEVSALTFNKSLCKKALEDVPGVCFAKELLINKNDAIDPKRYVKELGLPFFIKPNASGSSFGVTKVKSEDQILPAIGLALTESRSVLLEEFIDGTEVSHGVMIVGGEDFVLPVTELVSKNEFFDYEAKYTDGMTDEITPARIPDSTTQLLNRTTLEIYKTLGCRGVVRVDYIINQDRPYFIEVNTVPGMSANSIVPQQWRHMGYSMQDAFTMIINDSSELKKRNG